MKHKLRLAITLVAIWTVIFLAVLQLDTMRALPQCYEDVVLVGQGNFEGGRWDRYVCGPALDDFTTPNLPPIYFTLESER